MPIAIISANSPACNSAIPYVKIPNEIEPIIALAGLIFSVLSRMYIPINDASIMQNIAMDDCPFCTKSTIPANRLLSVMFRCETVGQPDIEALSHSELLWVMHSSVLLCSIFAKYAFV